jgi:hypothetical protein
LRKLATLLFQTDYGVDRGRACAPDGQGLALVVRPSTPSNNNVFELSGTNSRCYDTLTPERIRSTRAVVDFSGVRGTSTTRPPVASISSRPTT